MGQTGGHRPFPICVAFVVFALIPDVPTSIPDPLTQASRWPRPSSKAALTFFRAAAREGQQGRFGGLIAHDDEVIE